MRECQFTCVLLSDGNNLEWPNMANVSCKCQEQTSK